MLFDPYVPYFFRYKVEFFFLSKSVQNKSDSISLGLFRKDKTFAIAKFHRTDLVICVIVERGKPRLIAR